MRSTMMAQFGMRDWGQLAARTGARALQWRSGQHVTGRYLDLAFSGVVTAASPDAPGLWRLTLQIDDPAEPVAAGLRATLRQPVHLVVDPRGESREKRLDGRPLITVGPQEPQPEAP